MPMSDVSNRAQGKGSSVAQQSMLVTYVTRCSLETAAPRTSLDLLDCIHRTRVPAHEPPSNGSAPFRAADRVCAPDFCFAGAACRSRATSGARSAPFGVFSSRVSDCRDSRHPTGTLTSQTFLALAFGLRFSRGGLLHVHQSFHGSGLVSVHVSLLRRRHSLGPGIDAAAVRNALSYSVAPHRREARHSLHP